MNSNQQKALITIAVVIVSMILYPPWNQIINSGMVFNRGYSFITEAPTDLSSVNIGLLLTQILAASIVGVILYFVDEQKAIQNVKDM